MDTSSAGEGVLDLGGGRRLGYAAYGPPRSAPVVYCHGFPGNRLEYRLIEPALKKSGIETRVAVFDRPGYGRSSFQARRSVLDWPADVAAAADQLGIKDFSVLGISGGGPYALACAYALPDRVKRVGVVAGVAPHEATGMDSVLVTSRNARVRRVQYARSVRAFRKEGGEDRYVDQMMAAMGEADRPLFDRPDVRQWLIETTRESFTQGGRATAHDLGLYMQPWGFDPASIGVETRLWYGGLDETIPASAGRWLADRMDSAQLVIWPQHGHVTWAVADEATDVMAAMAN